MWMLQRFKTIIADQMPKKRDNIVICRLAAEQEEVYMRVLDSPDYQQLINMDNPCRCGSGEKTRNCHMLDMDGVLAKWSHPDGENCNRCPSCLTMPALLQLQKIANHLELLKPEEGMSDEVFQKQSDFARMAFGDPCMNVTRDRNFFSQSHATHCGKMKALGTLLKTWKKNGCKVLLFSYSTQMLDILQDFITRQGYAFLRLDGSTSNKQRGERVHKFNTSPSVFLFMLSTKAGGLGLNLVSANKVVVFDPNWNPSWDMQAQDRAYRIGQRQDVEVYRFVSSNTIEEKVYHRQLFKQGQEGLVLHQRDEHRYFDTGTGSRREGDLFGIKNLLKFDRDALQKSDTAGTIKEGRNAFDHEEDGEEDAEAAAAAEDGGFVIKRGEQKGIGDEDEEEEGEEEETELEGDGVAQGVAWILGQQNKENNIKKANNKKGESSKAGGVSVVDDDEEDETESQDVGDVLRKAGVVHQHLASSVLGGKALNTFKQAPAKSGGGGAASSAAAASNKPVVDEDGFAPVKEEKVVKEERSAAAAAAEA